MKVSVFGQRNIQSSQVLYDKWHDVVSTILHEDGGACLVFLHGGASGPQDFIKDYLTGICDIVLFQPWSMVTNKLGKFKVEFFHYRNMQIVDNSDVVVFFDNGTDDKEMSRTLAYAKSNGVRHHVVPISVENAVEKNVYHTTANPPDRYIKEYIRKEKNEVTLDKKKDSKNAQAVKEPAQIEKRRTPKKTKKPKQKLKQYATKKAEHPARSSGVRYSHLNASKKRVAIAVDSVRSHTDSTDSEEDKKIIGNVQLESRRGQKVNEAVICDECGGATVTAWKYSKSNRGEIYLCSICKPYVFNRSFGSVDALDHAETGGLFEGNRNKH